MSASKNTWHNEPLLHNSSFTYDPLGRTLTATDQLGHTTTYTYDLVGNLLTTKAADNVVTSTRIYDALNRLLSDKDGKNQTISYTYDPLGRMISYTDAKGATFAFGYDLLGRLVLRTEPDTTWQSYNYDVGGRLLVHRKADGQTKTHVYGNAQRDFLTQVSYSTGEPARVMTYDRLGRMLSAANGSSTVTRGYDAAGRLTGETQALTGGPTGSFVYQYNYATDDGNLTRHTRPDGSHLDYAWNARSLLAGITSDAPPPVATYSYNARNQIGSTVIENGLFTATRSYDAAGRLTGVSNGALDTTGYTLTPDGRRTGINRNGDTESYGYDNARQVTSGNYGGLSTTQSWNYDPAGNRQNATTNGVVTNYLANSVNAYTSITGGGHVPPAPTYDPNGNATTWNVLPLGSSSLESSVFTWNIHNELTSATNTSGAAASYAYDALGRRVKRVETLGGVTTSTWFLYNGWNVELEHNGTAHTRRHTWGLDLSNSLQGAGGVGGLVMVEHLDIGSGPEPYFPTCDGNGNITAWVDATGTVTARQRYDAFGNILSQTGIAPSNYAFSTKPREKVAGLYYYGYRYYDPVSGRWINRDPIEESGGLNLYGFAENCSFSFMDVMGLTSALFGQAAAKPNTEEEKDKVNCAGYGFTGTKTCLRPKKGSSLDAFLKEWGCDCGNFKIKSPSDCKCPEGSVSIIIYIWTNDRPDNKGKDVFKDPINWGQDANGRVTDFHVWRKDPGGKWKDVQGRHNHNDPESDPSDVDDKKVNRPFQDHFTKKPLDAWCCCQKK